MLGKVQDGGVPHLGCQCDYCEQAREAPAQAPGLITALMLKETSDEDSIRYLVEATPDIRLQVTNEVLDGVFVPHAKLGHVSGLLFFGEEGMDADHLAVYCNEGTEHFLMTNDPYRMLVDRENIDIREFREGAEEELQGGTITAYEFDHPHLSDTTTGYFIEGEQSSLFYLPDVQEWTDRMKELIERADVAIIDGTFWSETEIDRYEEVPHPTIEHSMDEFADFDTEVYFTHLNHTNPALREDSEERAEMERRGFRVVDEGQVFEV